VGQHFLDGIDAGILFDVERTVRHDEKRGQHEGEAPETRDRREDHHG
jgi:hypothetical protein